VEFCQGIITSPTSFVWPLIPFQLRLFQTINNNKIAVEFAQQLACHIGSLHIPSHITDVFMSQQITSPIVGFLVTNFPLWKLGYLLNQHWLEEDILNAMSELLYFRREVLSIHLNSSFIYEPTLFMNEAWRLYHEKPRRFSKNITDLRHRLHGIQGRPHTLFFNLWDSGHFTTFCHVRQSKLVVYGDSLNGEAPADVLEMLCWVLSGVDGWQTEELQIVTGAMLHQHHDEAGVGSCAIAAHNFVECRVDHDVPQWDASFAPAFRNKSLIELIVYHFCALGCKVRFFGTVSFCF
jgi:hypothetical protein